MSRIEHKDIPSNLQLTELLLLRDEFLDIWEWLKLCECDGLESTDRIDVGCKIPANGLGVTVTIGWTEPETHSSYYELNESLLFILKNIKTVYVIFVYWYRHVNFTLIEHGSWTFKFRNAWVC